MASPTQSGGLSEVSAFLKGSYFLTTVALQSLMQECWVSLRLTRVRHRLALYMKGQATSSDVNWRHINKIKLNWQKDLSVSTHLGSICVCYAPSISTLSFSQPLLEETFTTASFPLPTSGNVRKFGDNYNLLEIMLLEMSAASWVGKTARNKTRRFPFFLSPLGNKIVWVTMKCEQRCFSAISFYSINFQP